MAANYTWDTAFLDLFARCTEHYRAGRTDSAGWFTEADRALLGGIGCREREFFDFIEDHCCCRGEPSAAAALLIAAARRDYFLTIQQGAASDRIVEPRTLPARDDTALGGLPWLARITVKARAKLRGEMHPDTMYGCGGDRDFLATHDAHPADFLRAVWAAGDDDQKVVAWLKGART
jgi:Domain of unknown function (DUF5069)